MIEQRSEEWHAARLGKITGTRATDMIGSKTVQKTLAANLIKEMVTSDSKTFTPTKDMQRGIDLEDGAISYYQIQTGMMVSEGGFIQSFDPIAACSPDGLVGADGGLEIKCLNEENHIKVIIDDDIDKKYYWQIQWCMFCTGRQWWDYMGYNPDLPEPLTSYFKRYHRDEKVMEELSTKLRLFLAYLNGITDRMNIGF